MTRENPHLDAAVRYASVGWHVFPLSPDSKVPLPKTHGLLEASTDERQVVRWFERHPDRNIGVATGAPGPDVLDVDTKGERSNGYADWNEAKRAGLVRTPRAIVATPSGGMHAYYRGTDQRSGALRQHGLDYRAQGGYVVAVPSVVGGKAYTLVQSQKSADTCDWTAIRNHLEPQPERPAWQPRDGRPREVGHLAGWLASVGEGNVDRAFFWALNRAREAGDMGAIDQLAKVASDRGYTAGQIAARLRSAERTTPSPKAPVQREAG
jgi:Bifunctional DNA primase/polymerase, N-terminal